MKYWEILLKKHRERGKDGLTIPFLIGSQQYLKSDEIQDIPALIYEMAKGKIFETCIRYCMGTQTLIAEIRKPKNEVYNVIDSKEESTNLSIGISSKDDLGENLENVYKALVEKFQYPIDSGLFSAEPNVDQRSPNWQKYSEEDIQFIKNSFNQFQILKQNKIAVETLTLKEVSELFQESFKIAYPKANIDIMKELLRLKNEKIYNYKWVLTYEEFKGAKVNFYCQKYSHLESPVVSIGMTHRTTKGLILVALDTSNGGIPINNETDNSKWQNWVKIHTAHYCQRYAERILGISDPTFKQGSEGIMFADDYGPVRVTDNIADGVDEIEYQFKEGQAFGYRDINSKITFFRTVYSNDMLKGDRLKFREEWALSLEELSEVFNW